MLLVVYNSSSRRHQLPVSLAALVAEHASRDQRRHHLRRRRKKAAKPSGSHLDAASDRIHELAPARHILRHTALGAACARPRQCRLVRGGHSNFSAAAAGPSQSALHTWTARAGGRLSLGVSRCRPPVVHLRESRSEPASKVAHGSRPPAEHTRCIQWQIVCQSSATLLTNSNS